MTHLISTWNRFAIAAVLSMSLAPLAQAAPEKAATIAQGMPTTQPANVLPDADIVTVADSIDDFSTLVQAIETAELTEALMGEGPFTVFAPTNEAFADLDRLLSRRYGIGVADLLEPENLALLVDVLAYHVVPGAIASGDIPNGITMVDSLGGDPLQINRGGDDINIESVAITAFDVPATNGVIHVVEHVLLPPELVATLEEMRVAETTSPAETTVERVTTTEATVTTTETTTTREPAAETAPAEPVRGLW